MKITAALAWWNEQPAILTACVLALGNVADRVVALDGSYRRYPGATIRSSDEEVTAIREAAAEAGIEAVIIQPDRLWAGQVEKRSVLLQEASKDSDWVLVVDADHIVTTSRVAARAALQAMPGQVRFVSVDFTTPLNPDRSLDESAATNWHKNTADRTLDMAVLFRACPNFEVRQKHWVYWGSRSGPQTEMRYGGKADAKLPVPFLVEHRTLFRSEAQVLASRAFLNDREMVVAATGQEDDDPRLPRPKWDYETVPYARSTPTATGDAMNAPAPWSRTEPNRVISLGEAARALESGYPVALRIRGGDLMPDVRSGEVIAFAFDTSIRGIHVGDIVLARARNEIVTQRVVGKVGDRYQVASRYKKVTLASKVYGVLVYHGAHWPEPAPKAPTSANPPLETAKLAVPAPVKRKPVKPAVKLDGRTKAARALR